MAMLDRSDEGRLMLDYMQRDPKDAAQRMGVRQQSSGAQFLAALQVQKFGDRAEFAKGGLQVWQRTGERRGRLQPRATARPRRSPPPARPSRVRARGAAGER